MTKVFAQEDLAPALLRPNEPAALLSFGIQQDLLTLSGADAQRGSLLEDRRIQISELGPQEHAAGIAVDLYGDIGKLRDII